MRRILAGAVLALFFLGTASYGVLLVSKSRTFMFFGDPITRVETSEKVVALTFDDGPTKNTDQVLAMLDELNVKATFFVTGAELEENPAEGRKLAAAGHQLGNHSYHHNRMVFKSPDFIRSEIESTDRLIREAGYTGEILFRPPNCKKLLLLPYYLKQNDRKTIIWDLEPDSYPEVNANSQRIVENVVANVKPGSIILLHVMYDGREESRKSIPGIVEALRKEGYRFVTVSELLNYG